jgi:predicted phosphoadenosine phosphosulfate sulfurtransferase
MAKIYSNVDVLTASLERIRFIFSEFEAVCVSFSGGKDSSVTVQLFDIVAREIGRKFDVMYIDLEANYKKSIDHVSEIKTLKTIDNFYHICLPFSLSNASSIFQPSFKCWDKSDKEKWVRDMPDNCINEDNNIFNDIFKYGMEFEEFVPRFPKWLMKKHKVDKVAIIVGIRADESLNRFKAVCGSKEENMYKSKNYSTKISNGVYNFYPIYDYKTQDIWGCVFKLGFMYNKIYDDMTANGVGIHQQRVCYPYGEDQRVSLNQYAILEPEIWDKIMNRVSGVNFGSLYCKTKLLGHNGTSKPKHMNWEQYAVFLLESLAIYSPDLTRHYIMKINRYLDYYNENFGVTVPEIYQDISKKEIIDKHGELTRGDFISWKKIARCIEKNDFTLRGCSYGVTLADKEIAKKLHEKWGDLLGLDEYNTKEFKKLKDEIL